MATTANPYIDTAVAAANKYGVPVNMFLWQIGQESNWDPNAASKTSSAKGLGQFVDGTAKQFGINPLDPTQSLDAAAKYDAQLFKQNGTWQGALTQYGTLANASSDTIAGFKNALGYDASNGTPGTSSSLQDFGSGPLSVSSLTDNISTWLKSGAFIILGVVIIALAILSNKSVQGAAVAVATKGR